MLFDAVSRESIAVGWLGVIKVGGFRPGYMMLMSEGEGEGARDETTLDTREFADTSQFCSSSNSSSFDGPLEMFSVLDVRGGREGERERGDRKLG